MTFKPEDVTSFLELFENTKSKIRHFEGCEHLELMRDFNNPNVFSTYSKWLSEGHLNNYRKSALFGQVWKDTKSKFAEKPIAFSMQKFIKVD
jgi:quinol monooxygenase YgiN